MIDQNFNFQYLIKNSKYKIVKKFSKNLLILAFIIFNLLSILYSI